MLQIHVRKNWFGKRILLYTAETINDLWHTTMRGARARYVVHLNCKFQIRGYTRQIRTGTCCSESVPSRFPSTIVSLAHPEAIWNLWGWDRSRCSSQACHSFGFTGMSHSCTIRFRNHRRIIGRDLVCRRCRSDKTGFLAQIVINRLVFTFRSHFFYFFFIHRNIPNAD